MKKIILLFLLFYSVCSVNSFGQNIQQPEDHKTCEGGTAFFGVQVYKPDDCTFHWQIEESPNSWSYLENGENYIKFVNFKNQP